MKTYISDLIPKLQRFSQKLDNLTLLTNQHWVVFDGITDNKNVYIFRENNELLISLNGKVEKAKWEYLGNNSLLIDKKDESFLFKHGFFDENVLALKVDSKEEYAFLVNETKYEGELNSIEKVFDFLNQKYIEPNVLNKVINISENNIEKIDDRKNTEIKFEIFETKKGLLKIELNNIYSTPEKGNKVYMSNAPAPSGKYKLDFMYYIHVENGEIKEVSLF
jgi:DNA-binding Xre family transcriptional regulator